MSGQLEKILGEARRCQICAHELPMGPRPIIQAGTGARILIVGQAPGRKVHLSGVPWDDQSGDRLREWMGIDKARFYDPDCIAILPMGFCYPGAVAGGGDRPPDKRCAPAWHQRIREELPNVELTLLVGGYAQKYYLEQPSGSLTDTVAAFEKFMPTTLPLPHPSWRVVGWMRRNGWFESKVLPALRERVAALVSDDH
ncbi:uracil-DNA glycosylase family protein [Devosia rhodophyticola]|uniref:Uracil-DNA glycosylase family protein n=1 Tax=Devosia rhodophyticola TaxID=3026423 RepID=A0ABY7YX81_9HYPH|nr:uracil-DNA glycosylase family protein [Devosia rhodophyticola]WDR05851.1 uracil-DNA glycosylase family protein [Devosia rhodophyticola]